MNNVIDLYHLLLIVVVTVNGIVICRGLSGCRFWKSLWVRWPGWLGKCDYGDGRAMAKRMQRGIRGVGQAGGRAGSGLLWVAVGFCVLLWGVVGGCVRGARAGESRGPVSWESRGPTPGVEAVGAKEDASLSIVLAH